MFRVCTQCLYMCLLVAACQGRASCYCNCYPDRAEQRSFALFFLSDLATWTFTRKLTTSSPPTFHMLCFSHFLPALSLSPHPSVQVTLASLSSFHLLGRVPHCLPPLLSFNNPLMPTHTYSPSHCFVNVFLTDSFSDSENEKFKGGNKICFSSQTL